MPYLKQSKGSIVNVGSIAGHTGGGGGSGIYAAAKAAVATETIAMAQDFGKFGIRVNSVLPGFIETRFHQRFSSAERRNGIRSRKPLRRMRPPSGYACFSARSPMTGSFTFWPW